MEIIIAIVIVGVGLIWYYNNKAAEKQAQDAKNADEAPYKVEAQVVETVNAEASVGSVVAETKPVKTKKTTTKKATAAKPKTATKTAKATKTTKKTKA